MLVNDHAALERINDLIREAKGWRLFHKQRGQAGHVEALAASIRIKALEDAKTAVRGCTR